MTGQWATTIGLGRDRGARSPPRCAESAAPTVVILYTSGARHIGVGADGLVISRAADDDAFVLEVACFNADGLVATMCGNVLRCVAWAAQCDQGFRTMQLRMAGVMHEATVDTDSVWVTAEAGAIQPRVLQTVINGRPTWFDSAHIGTEHVVAVVDNVDAIHTEVVGRVVRHHKNVAPLGTNVTFVQHPAAKRSRSAPTNVVSRPRRSLAAAAPSRPSSSPPCAASSPNVRSPSNLAGEPLTVRLHDDHPNRAAWVGGPVAQPSTGYSHDSGGPVNWAGQAVMVKPPFGGSSVGVSLVRDAADLPRALAEAAGESDEEVLVEDYVIGTPVTVGMLELPGGSVIVFPPLTTEATDADFYDADTKLDMDPKGAVTVRAELEPVALNRIARDARTLWDGTGLRGSARIDFIVTEDGDAYVLEVNSTPGMSVTATSRSGRRRSGARTGMFY